MKTRRTPIKLQLGTWREMDYDASLVLDGITWHRAHGGFSSETEDWVADIPGMGLHVTRFRADHYRSCGRPHPTRQKAMRAEVRQNLGWVDGYIKKAQDELDGLRIGKARMTAAIKLEER